MKKSWLVLLLALCLINPFQAFAKAFDDVPATSPYFYAVEYLKQNKVFPEGDKFNPSQLVTKADFVRYLVKLNSPDFKPTKAVKLPFSDTKNNASYAPYFDEAITLGILDDREKKIEPFKKINLMDGLELLFHSQSIPIPKTFVGNIPYKDLNQNKRAQPLVMRALDFDLITPDSKDNVGIYKKLTKGDAAMMMYKMDMINLTPASSANQSQGESDPGLQKIIDSWKIINTNFYNRDLVDPQAMSEAAINAMVKTLDDPYTTYFKTAENKAFSDDLDGQIEGIGAYLEVNETTKDITIVSPIKDSPAFKAGIKAGDIIKTVDDKDVTGMTLLEVVSLIKGPKGTTVKLGLLRDGQTVTISVVRDKITIHAVETETIGGDILKINLIQFSQNAASEFDAAVQEATGNPAIKGIILDLRNDPGGLLDAAVHILGHFLPDGSKAVSIAYSNFNYAQTTNGNGELGKYPLVVLINKGSASASEIVAGAIKDFKLGTLVGEKSFGKGTVQEINYFKDNSSLKITIAKWLTPNGTSIQKLGIEPDIAVTKDANGTTDPQLDSAITEVRRLMQYGK